MKKILLFFTTMMFSLAVNAAQFEQGTHYKVLEEPKSSTSKVTEFFSFYCPHCYNFEPVINQLKASLPEGTKLEKVHVAFMGNDMAVPMAKSYATMVALDAEETMVPAMFKQIHELKAPPKDEQALRQVFVDNGIDGKKFDSAYNSFVVNSMQRGFDKQFNKSTLTGVPGVVVNNKYLVKTEQIGSFEEYSQLVNYLLTL
ncbi:MULTISPECIES: thiol:disulfide interchange protein DsbA/DsbL [unclassified Vibrio]|uniref:thiol:disulfide interchange protein DsbA/DsbL n=1 Tax=unclassified Vibrio TaxID=2614977 RepID=UPI001110B756|nr:thiol:disulfide interchange protein DsbA/DsbL [Vibrio sp. Hep-1b-8]TMX32580.1 thiol:disulfide interchange protein [Vibrio sp. Hep-1b-8]